MSDSSFTPNTQWEPTKKFHFPLQPSRFIVKYLNCSLAHFATDSTFQQSNPANKNKANT